jgi:hypothetical protein
MENLFFDLSDVEIMQIDLANYFYYLDPIGPLSLMGGKFYFCFINKY